MTRVLSGKLDALVTIARSQNEKHAFVDTASAAQGAGGGAPPGGPGGPPPGGPSGPPPGMGGPPPGGDPSGGGGGPPPDIQAMITSAVQQAMQGMGGGPGGGADGGMIKPKIDVNVEIMQIKNLLAKIADALSVPIPAQDMVATPDKLTAMAQGQPTATPGGGGPPGGGGIGGIPPMQGIGGGGGGASKSSAFHQGEPAGSVRMLQLSDRASALAAVMSRR